MPAIFCVERAVRVQARHFVLVLVGHQLEDSSARPSSVRRACRLPSTAVSACAHPRDQVAVLLRVRGVLVVGQEGDAFCDHIVQAFGRALELDHLRLGAGAGPLFYHDGQVVRGLRPQMKAPC
jgi:hypothetical protein